MSSVVKDHSDNQQKVWLRVLVITLAFGFTAFGALNLMRHAAYISAVWPANGILLSAIMMAKRRHLPAFLGAAFVANVAADLFNGQSFAVASYLSACSLVEMLTAVILTRVYQPGEWIRLEQPKVLASFWGTICLIAPLASATLASLGLNYFVNAPTYEVFITWWVANALGLAVVTPPLLILSRDGAKASLAAINNRSALVSLVILAAVTFVVFSQTRYPIIFLVFPPMVLVAFNAGFLGVAVALVLITVESITMTILGRGPLTLISNITPNEMTILVQMFLAAHLIMAFPVAASLSQRRKLEQQLETLATTDTLTGLATRRRFEEHYHTVWAEALREGKPIALLMLDIDFFKPYNDSYGHLQGDQCIRSIAAIIGAAARRPLDLAVRYGGEEFLLLLPNTAAEGAVLLANEIHQTLAAANIQHRDSPHEKITISIGLAVAVPEAGTASVDLIEAADKALYRAKHAGRSRTESADLPTSPASSIA